MQEALLKVKMDLGSEAVIMNSRKVKQKGFFGLFKKPMLEVVAAIDDDYVRPARTSVLQQPKINIAPASINNGYNDLVKNEKMQNSASNTERQMINNLENKVKNMESMLEQIYQVVQDKDKEQDKDKDKDKEQDKDREKEQEKQQEKDREKEQEKQQEKDREKEYDKEKKKYKDETNAHIVNNISDALEESTINEVEVDGGNLSILGQTLLEKDVEPRLIEKILNKIKEKGGSAFKLEEVMNLAGRVMTILLGEPEPLSIKEGKKPHVAIFVGPTGVGKTTTLAKIAADFTLNGKKKVGLITADTYRIAAVEQLKTYAEILNLSVSVVYSSNEIKDAVEKLSDNDLILIDTAGRSHKNKADFSELKTLIGTVNADDTYLVMSCNTSRIAIKEILEYYAFIKNYKLIFTKLDESPALGVILNARYMTGKPLSYTTAGQSVPDDLDVADVKQLVASILSKPSN